MSLDPAASPWPGVVASVAVCLWIAAIGALLAHAVFRDRPRLVWPFYAPIVGVAVVLLVTNLAAYVIPGAPAAWFGLLVPSALGAIVAWRGGTLRPLPRGSKVALLAMALVAVGVFVLAYANRTHMFLWDDTWHFGLAQRLARGAFPPVTPFGVDAGIGYHYGHDLLAASIIGTTGAPPWAAFDALTSFLVVALLLAVVGFAYGEGAPLPLALGLGAAVGSFDGGAFLGVDAAYLAGGAYLDSSAVGQAFRWVDRPQWTLAVGFVVLVAAALQGGVRGRQAMLLTAGAGAFALADAAVMLFSCTALALVGTVRLLKLRGRNRFILTAALSVSALLVVLAGGPISDALFSRGGTADTVRVAWEPVAGDLLPLQPVGPLLLKVGIIPLAAIGAAAAYRRRSWGLGFLAAAATFGLLEAQLLHTTDPLNDLRIHYLALCVAMIGALSGAAGLVGALRWNAHRLAGTLALGLLVVLPTALPRAIAGAHLLRSDLEVRNPQADDSGHHYRDRFFLGEHLEANWEFYAWMRRSLSTEARLLTPHALVSAAAAGVASPRSGRDLQVFSNWVITPVYADALLFLHRDDLAEMGITHLHVTDGLVASLARSARRLLDDPGHFRLMVDMHTSSGARHRVFQVMPGAGTTEIAPASFRALHQVLSPNLPISTLGSLTLLQRQLIFQAFVDSDHLRAAYPTIFDRATRIPRIQTLTDRPARGVVILGEPLEPTAISVSRDEALWVGHGMRAYDLAAAWSPVWRIGPAPASLPEQSRSVCESAADGQVDLRLLGEPAAVVTAGSTELTLTGLPQVIQLAVPDCGELALSADSEIAPFAQIRPHHPDQPPERDTPVAGLGFDGGADGQRAIIHLRYQNSSGVPFVTGTEIRVYAASPLGVSLHPDNPNSRTASLKWWPHPIALHLPEQTARIEFDARRLEINGDPGGGSATSLTPGRTYLVALNIAGVNPTKGYLEIQHIIPLARVVVGETGVDYEVLSSIVTIEHHAPGTSR